MNGHKVKRNKQTEILPHFGVDIDCSFGIWMHRNEPANINRSCLHSLKQHVGLRLLNALLFFFWDNRERSRGNPNKERLLSLSCWPYRKAIRLLHRVSTLVPQRTGRVHVGLGERILIASAKTTDKSAIMR